MDFRPLTCRLPSSQKSTDTKSAFTVWRVSDQFNCTTSRTPCYMKIVCQNCMGLRPQGRGFKPMISTDKPSY